MGVPGREGAPASQGQATPGRPRLAGMARPAPPGPRTWSVEGYLLVGKHNASSGSAGRGYGGSGGCGTLEWAAGPAGEAAARCTPCDRVRCSVEPFTTRGTKPQVTRTLAPSSPREAQAEQAYGIAFGVCRPAGWPCVAACLSLGWRALCSACSALGWPRLRGHASKPPRNKVPCPVGPTTNLGLRAMTVTWVREIIGLCCRREALLCSGYGRRCRPRTGRSAW